MLETVDISRELTFHRDGVLAVLEEGGTANTELETFMVFRDSDGQIVDSGYNLKISHYAYESEESYTIEVKIAVKRN